MVNGLVTVAAAGLLGWLPAHRLVGMLLAASVPGYGEMDRVKQNKLACVTLSTLHAVGLLLYAVRAVFLNGALVRDSVLDYQADIGFLTHFTAGYFLHDTLNQVQFNLGEKGTLGMLGHHALFLSACCLLLNVQAGAFIPMLWALTELSTPFINLRTALDLTGARRTRPSLYLANGIAILVTFTGRMLVSLAIIWLLTTVAWSGPRALRAYAPLSFALQFVESVVMLGLNSLWYAKIVRMVAYRCRGGAPRGDD